MDEQQEQAQQVVTLDGHKVAFKGSLGTLKDSFDIIGLVNAASMTDLRTQVPLMVKMIDAWDFGGDPTNKASYDDLDTLRVVIPLARAMHQWLNHLMSEADAAAKN